jgi:hypothetical protein
MIFSDLNIIFYIQAFPTVILLLAIVIKFILYMHELYLYLNLTLHQIN